MTVFRRNFMFKLMVVDNHAGRSRLMFPRYGNAPRYSTFCCMMRMGPDLHGLDVLAIYPKSECGLCIAQLLVM